MFNNLLSEPDSHSRSCKALFKSVTLRLKYIFRNKNGINPATLQFFCSSDFNKI